MKLEGNHSFLRNQTKSDVFFQTSIWQYLLTTHKHGTSVKAEKKMQAMTCESQIHTSKSHKIKWNNQD